jgi:hypothetical protein
MLKSYFISDIGWAHCRFVAKKVNFSQKYSFLAGIMTNYNSNESEVCYRKFRLLIRVSNMNCNDNSLRENAADKREETDVRK